MSNDLLSARVKAVNRANECAKQLYPVLREVFEPLVGQKVLTADGSLMKRIKDKLPELPNTGRLSVHFNCGTIGHLVGFTINTCENVPPHFCTYHNIGLYIGWVRDGILTELAEPFDGRTDWTAEEVLQAREEYKAAQKAAEQAKSKLGPFGEYDRA